MTVQNLYTQYLDGKVTKAKFLYEVRRDQNMDMISHHNNFEDTIKILKNKNIISEKASKESKQPTGKQEVDIIAKTIDMVNPYEYSRGMRYELEMVDVPTRTDLTEDEILKAQKKVLVNLTKNPQYYFDKLNGKGEVSDKWVETTKKNIEAIGKGKAAKGLMRENLGHNELSSIHQEGSYWIVTVRTPKAELEKTFNSEAEARKFQDNLDGLYNNRIGQIRTKPLRREEYSQTPKNTKLQVRPGDILINKFSGSKYTVINVEGNSIYTENEAGEEVEINSLRNYELSEVNDVLSPLSEKEITIYEKYAQKMGKNIDEIKEMVTKRKKDSILKEEKPTLGEIYSPNEHLEARFYDDGDIGLIVHRQGGRMEGKSPYIQTASVSPENFNYTFIKQTLSQIGQNVDNNEIDQFLNKVKEKINTPKEDDLNEDIDLGHQDNEPHAIKADLYQIAKQASELYKTIDSVDNIGEVDFPHWWQAKIILAKNYLEGAKDYLDGELSVSNEDGEMEEGATYAGKDAVDDASKDPKFGSLSGTGKIDAINKLKQGGTVTIG